MEEKDYFDLQLGRGRLSPSTRQDLASASGKRAINGIAMIQSGATGQQDPAESGFLRFFRSDSGRLSCVSHRHAGVAGILTVRSGAAGKETLPSVARMSAARPS